MIKFLIKLSAYFGHDSKGPRRKRRKGNEMNDRFGNAPEGMPGYGQPQQGYAAPQVPYTSYNEQQGYSQPPAQGNYVPYNGMPSGQPSAPYSVPQPLGNSGSYIPQTPYSPGYTSPGYQPAAQSYPPQGGYPQPGGSQAQMNGYPPQGGYPPQTEYQPSQPPYMPGYNPYGQMGRAPQQQSAPKNDYNPNIPLNGGGYVPQNVHVRKREFELANWMLIAAGVVLVALFAAGVLILKSTPLKIALILLAAATTAALWLRPLTAENKRLTYTILSLALCLLTIVSFLLNPPADTTRNGTDTTLKADSIQQQDSLAGDIPEIPLVNETAETTPGPDSGNNVLMERLITFFTHWSENRQDEMLAYCAPSWIAKQESPRTSLFTLIGNRNPTECTPGSITGTDADSSRRVTMLAKIDRHNGKKPELYQFTILMVKENNEWYVDPQSLQSNEVLETPDPNVTPTVTPTATPYVDANTPLYYNPNGGEYYHLDAYCRSANAKNLPFAGQFTYAQINDPPYNNLKPCNQCGAPLREQ